SRPQHAYAVPLRQLRLNYHQVMPQYVRGCGSEGGTRVDLCPSPHQQELIDLAHRLAVDNFAPRAAQYDREASFPFADYDDLRAAGLLAICVPERYGGLSATFETYCLVAEHIAQGNAATALTFNMHCLTMLMMG